MTEFALVLDVGGAAQNRSEWPHFLRLEDDRSTTFGVLMQMWRCPQENLMVRSPRDSEASSITGDTGLETRGSFQHLDGFKMWDG